MTAYKTRLIILTTFLIRTITTRTLLDGTLTVTLIPTLRPTLALLRLRLYRTSEAPLKLLHVNYNLLLTNCQRQKQTGGQTGSSIQDQMLQRSSKVSQSSCYIKSLLSLNQ